MRGPDFFIVGAPKCGTTSLDEYLRQHPDIFVPQRKELHYFGSDLQFYKAPRLTAAEYLSHLTPGPAHRRLGECSVWYLYSRRAASEIRRFNPAAQIIIMLRNPVDMMHSLHSQFLYESNEDIADFASALAAERDRRMGLRIPPRIYFPAGLQYRRVARYAEQVRRYLDAFGRENVHVIDFAEFAADTPRVYAQVLEFLGVDPSFRCDFQVLNANKQVRSFAVQKFFNNPSPSVLSLARKLVPTPLRHALIAFIKRFNTQRVGRPSVEPSLRRQLELEFVTEVDQLSELLDRDFSRWFGLPRRGMALAG